jgi:hypothetical protein
LSPGIRDKHLVKLLEHHYNAIHPTPELLLEALAPGQTAHAHIQVFGLLAGPTVDVFQSARTLVRAVRISVTSTVQTAPPRQIVRYGLEAMSLKFPPLACAQVVAQVAGDELYLLPSHLQAVRRICAEFLKNQTEAFGDAQAQG